MKTTTLCIAIIFSMSVNSQISKESSYQITGTNYDDNFIPIYENIVYKSNCVGYVLTDLNNKSFRLYNSDHTLTKESSVMTAVEGTSICVLHSMFYFTSHFVNGDEKIEFFACWGCEDAYYLYLYDEDGNVIFNFGQVDYIYNYGLDEVSDCFIETKEGFKMILVKERDKIYDVYSFGVSSTSSLELQDTKINKAYPNPSNTILNIPCRLTKSNQAFLTIYDLSGGMVEKRQIDKNTNSLTLNISSYKPGIYMYEYENITQKFVVK